MLSRLKEIQEYLDGRAPTYSEIYHDSDLKKRFNSCSLAGVIYRFNQDHGIASYADFCEQHLGWEVPRKLTKSRTEWVLKELVRRCGGVPNGLSKMKSVLGYRGMTLLAAVKKHFGKTLDDYCLGKKLKRVPSGAARRVLEGGAEQPSSNRRTMVRRGRRPGASR
jgi:hypothetical protein